jgi:hypothetical protein
MCWNVSRVSLLISLGKGTALTWNFLQFLNLWYFMHVIATVSLFFVVRYRKYIILLPIAVEVCEVESLWSTTEGALYYNIARQAFPDFYGVVSGGESLSTTKGALYYSIARQAFPSCCGVV